VADFVLYKLYFSLRRTFSGGPEKRSGSKCWLDTELANRQRKKCAVAKGGAIIVINFNSKLVQSKE
jgi:hypothetical protein